MTNRLVSFDFSLCQLEWNGMLKERATVNLALKEIGSLLLELDF